jgi:preprotein translocase subunit SecF
MEFFKSNTNINFMGQRKWAAVFSILLFVASLSMIAIHGLRFGLDFTGGIELHLHYDQAPQLSDIRTKLQAAGYQPVVQTYGTSKDIAVRIGFPKGAAHGELSTAVRNEIKTKVMASLPGASLQSLEYMGSQVSKSLLTNGILAIIVSLIAVMIYVALRFEYRFSISAAIALIHDPVLILGIFSLFHLEFNLIVMAGILTVIGYSLNDTIVVYDRVRENFRKRRQTEPVELMNISINETLSRTIMTSGLTLLVVLSLYFFGGPMVHNFSLALIIGIVIGTYSSIYVAGALALAFGLQRKHLVPSQRKDDSAGP